MGNSASQDHTSLRKAMSLCKERQKFLNKASKRRCDLAVAHLQFSGYHKEVADAINAFVGEQNPATTEQSHATTEYIVEMPEDDDDVEVMEEEAGLNTRRQGNNHVIEAHQLPRITNSMPEGTDVDLEFLRALKGVEEQFRYAYEYGKDVSKKLETKSIENKSKSLQPPKLLRSLSRSSSSRVHSLSFEESEIMGVALTQLKDWEEKLLKDLKKEKEEDKRIMKSDKSQANAEGEDHHTKKVNPHVEIGQISKEKVNEWKDKRLLPRLVEQLNGLMDYWKAMSRFYGTQKNNLSQVKESPPIGDDNHIALLCDDKHRAATKKLQEKLHNWRPRFASYMYLQTAYIEVLYCWLSMLVEDNDVKGWSEPLDNLVNNAETVTKEMKELQKDVEALRAQQGKEHAQKMKVNNLESRVNYRENRILKEEIDGDEKQKLEEEIGKLKKRIEENKKTHQTKRKETQQAVIKFKTRLFKVFEKLEAFSKAAAGNYAKLIDHQPKTRPRTRVDVQR